MKCTILQSIHEMFILLRYPANLPHGLSATDQSSTLETVADWPDFVADWPDLVADWPGFVTELQTTASPLCSRGTTVFTQGLSRGDKFHTARDFLCSYKGTLLLVHLSPTRLS